MFEHNQIAPSNVHSALRRHMLVDGYPLVVDLEHSSRSWLRDQASGDDYLDFFSFFASNPLGFNHPAMHEPRVKERLARAATMRVSNSDFYTTLLAEFVDTLDRACVPDHFPHYFFVDGGALAVENAMKTAFDWKVRKNQAAGRGEKGSQILHLRDAFHGRSGYTLSVTNTDPVKTNHFPVFDWPRIDAPAIQFSPDWSDADTEALEAESLAQARRAFERDPHDIAAILIEPIQGEGGDKHFTPRYLRGLRALADEFEALLILDEVQTGFGLTGSWWAFEQLEVLPDIVCFAKKMQTGGIFVSRRVEEVDDHVFEKSSRINSTWGGSLVDMVRCTAIIEVIENERLLDNVQARGQELLAGLQRFATRFEQVSNPRGRGLMCALDVPDAGTRNAIIKRCFEDKMIVLPCGPRSIRFRPTLAVSPEAIAEGLSRLESALKAQFN